jgi:hypothetical protein
MSHTGVTQIKKSELMTQMSSYLYEEVTVSLAGRYRMISKYFFALLAVGVSLKGGA